VCGPGAGAAETTRDLAQLAIDEGQQLVERGLVLLAQFSEQGQELR
jgi:hypothetical protein